jgi:hypothetical protein
MDFTREQIALNNIQRAVGLNKSANFEAVFLSTSAGTLYVLSMDINGSYVILRKTATSDVNGTFDEFGYYYPQVLDYQLDWLNRGTLVYGLPK